MKVTGRRGAGHSAMSADMVLTDCLAESCSIMRLAATGKIAKVHVEGCKFRQNGEGVMAANDRGDCEGLPQLPALWRRVRCHQRSAGESELQSQ